MTANSNVAHESAEHITENVELDAIHHTAIQVRHIREAVNWYTKHYSCEVEYEDETWAMLKFANVSLALVTPGEHPYHFAIVTDRPQDYGTPKVHRDGTSSVYIKDPSGNPVEMLKLASNK